MSILWTGFSALPGYMWQIWCMDCLSFSHWCNSCIHSFGKWLPFRCWLWRLVSVIVLLVVLSICSPFSCSKRTNILVGQWVITTSPLHIHLWPFSAPLFSVHLGLFHTPLLAQQLSTHLLMGYTLPLYPCHIPGFVILLRLLDTCRSRHHIPSKHLNPLSRWHGIMLLKFNVIRICTN